ncbi:MAG: ATP-binding protein [Pseudomonadota bacterium]
MLVLVALLPMLVWAGGLTMWNATQERRAIETGLEQAVEALTLATDQSVRLTVEALSTLALSRNLATANYAGFRTQAEQLVARHPEWLNVVVVGPTGRQMVNTARSSGSPLPNMDSPAFGPAREAYRSALASGMPVISDLFRGPIHGRHMVAVAVPVVGRDGRATHVLMAGLRPDALADLLHHSDVPEGWVAGLLDRGQVMVARTMGHDQLIGHPAPDWYQDAVRGDPKGIVTGRSMHGPDLTYAFHRSSYTGWTTVFGAPNEVFAGHQRHVLILTAGFGALLLLVSLGLALWTARRILRPVRALSATAAPFVPQGKPGSGAYPVTELSDLHRALDGLAVALAESEARFKAVFAVAPVMLFVLDEDARYVEVNHTWLRVMGFARDEVIGRRPWDFQTAESAAGGGEVTLPAFLRQGALDDVPAGYVTKSGEVRDVLVSLRAERDRDGTTRRTIGAMRDVTEQRRIEKALNAAIEEAERANNAKTRFLAAASHDLRQPLQALSLYLGVLEAKLGDGERRLLGAVGQCVDSLSGLLNDLLDVARLDAGTITPKVEAVAVSQLMERVAASWGIQAEAKGLRLVVRPCGAVVRTDPALMERVLSNLVANAVRYTDRGRVVVGCRRVGAGEVRLEVWDTGVGIPEDRLGDIFEEFRQLGNPERRRDKGTGLGLAIVRRVTGLLGHPVSVRSRPGKGSVFAVRLPLTAAAAASPPTAVPAGRSRRILVVEDEIHVRSALELVLGGLGHEVAAGETVDEALARLGARRPELVIADYRLGGGATGVEAIRRVRALHGAELPAVVLTGDTDPAIIRRIAGEGLRVLHKPLQVEALRGFLGEVA